MPVCVGRLVHRRGWCRAELSWGVEAANACLCWEAGHWCLRRDKGASLWLYICLLRILWRRYVRGLRWRYEGMLLWQNILLLWLSIGCRRCVSWRWDVRGGLWRGVGLGWRSIRWSCVLLNLWGCVSLLRILWSRVGLLVGRRSILLRLRILLVIYSWSSVGLCLWSCVSLLCVLLLVIHLWGCVSGRHCRSAILGLVLRLSVLLLVLWLLGEHLAYLRCRNP